MATADNRKKLDNRIRVLIENCIQTNHRSFFVVVGEKAKSQVRGKITLIFN